MLKLCETTLKECLLMMLVDCCMYLEAGFFPHHNDEVDSIWLDT